MIDFRAPAFTMGKDRYDDIYQLAKNKGFSDSDADILAAQLPQVWDGMDGLNVALNSFINGYAHIYLSPEGQEVAKRLNI